MADSDMPMFHTLIISEYPKASLRSWLVAVVLFVVGGAAIHGMAFCLVTGVIVGT